MNPADYLTTQQAAHLLGITATRITVFIRQKRLPAEKVGNIWLIHKADLEKFTKQKRPQGWKKGRSRK